MGWEYHGMYKQQWQYGYGSIPTNTIFSGMKIHLPAILMFTRGTRFWHTAIWYGWCAKNCVDTFNLMAVLGVRCNPDVAPRRNCGGVACFWNAMLVDFQYVDVYVIHDDDDDVVVVIFIIIIFFIFIFIIIIPYEDKFVLLPDAAYVSKGWWICWSLMKISWCYSLFNIFVRGGGGFVDPLWR